MLRHLARFAPHHRLLLVAAFRDAEVGAGHPLADALGAFPRETDFERLRLEGLSAEGTARILAALSDQEVDDVIGRACVEETDGNPFFVGELLRHFVEEDNGLYRANPREEIMLRYYANSIAHLLPAAKPEVAAAE